MKKILYFMNVDWNWIKQRPHFIAERLGDDYEVMIVNHYRYNRKGFQRRQSPYNIIDLKGIPKIDRIGALRWINNIIKRKIIARVLNGFKPDYIYLTDPYQIDYLPKNCNTKLIYDCMDDLQGLAKSSYRRDRVYRNERIISTKCDLILFSSEYLKKLYINKYKCTGSEKFHIVRNAFDGEIVSSIMHKRSGRIKIYYFGTIAKWFDFNLIKESLDRLDNIEYVLIGPVDSEIKVPAYDRIQYRGTVEHNQLFEETKDADCFVMPFILTEAIRAVDPVKIYEYINFGKPIITIRYDEVKRFKNYVYFFRSCAKINLQYCDGFPTESVGTKLCA